MDIIGAFTIYLIGAGYAFMYAYDKGVIWKEAILVALLSWAGLFILWITDY